MRYKNLFFLFFLLLTVSVYFSQKKNILVLFSYHPELGWNQEIFSELEKELNTSKYPVDIFYEYMDTKNIISKEYFAKLAEVYAMKYAKKVIDVIVCVDNDALDFLLEYRDVLFGEKPVVFLGINEFYPEMLKGKKGFTGVVESIDFKKTIDIALKLTPQIKRFLVYGDNSSIYYMNKSQIEKESISFPEINFIIRNDMSIEQVIQDVRQAGPQSALIIISTLRSETGELVNYEDIAPTISTYSDIPIYVPWEFLIKGNVVGGYVISGYDLAYEAAQMVLLILQGKDVGEIPVLTNTLNRYIFDYNMLVKYSVDMGSIPENAVLISKPRRFIDEYRDVFLIFLVIFAAACILIVIILFYGFKKRQLSIKLENEKKIKESIIESASIMIIAIDEQRRIQIFNKYAQKVSGYDKTEVLGQKVYKFLDPDFPGSVMEGTLLCKDSGVKTIVWKKSGVYDRTTGEKLELFTGDDITQKKKSEAALYYSANFDQLTGLANRTLFLKVLSEQIEKSPDEKVSIFLMDIDRFKFVNDVHGHVFGDEVLKEVSKRLKKHFEKDGAFARMGGDEFIGYIRNRTSIQDIKDISEQILKSFSEPLKLNDADFFISISMGVTTYPDGGNDCGELLKNAEISMYKSKESGGNAFEVYETRMKRKISEKLFLQSHLRRAINEKQFLVYYQPIVDISGWKIKEAEALVRWNHPQWGIVPPSKFIDIAEESGFISAIGEEVLHNVCRDIIKTKQELSIEIKISLNLSMQQLCDPYLIEKFDHITEGYGINKELISVEVTESMAMQKLPVVRNTLYEFKKRGMGIMLDDFGTGYSSLSYLTLLPIDFIKIDRSFVNKISATDRDRKVISTIVAMAKGLNVQIIAEGVENEEQLDFLKKIGCDTIQGYYFSKPVSYIEFIKMFQ